MRNRNFYGTTERRVGFRAARPVDVLLRCRLHRGRRSVGKPDPEVFLKAATLASAEPQNCVVLEDSVHGIMAARRGGMKGLGLATTRDGKDLLEAGADLVVNHPSDLSIGLLASLFQS